MPDAFIDWNPGDPPLSAVQHAGNIRALWTRLGEVIAAAGTDIINGSTQSADLRTLTFQTSLGRTFSATLPPGPFFPKGPRIVGSSYAVDDLITWQGSSYIVLLPHVASVSLDTDLVANRLQLVAAKGRDSETFRGPYVAGLAYAAGDVVYTGTPGQEVLYFKAFADVAPADPGPPSFAWGQVSLSPYDELHVDVSGLPGAGAVVRRYAVPRPTYLLPGLPRSAASLDVATTAASVYRLTVNDVQVGTITFAAGSKVGVFAMAAFQFLNPGAVLRVVAPATQDATAAGLAVTLTLAR
ncbi:hypothetical protein [Methylobacterium iners]|uniref:Uncharacterized protein n=1 Tax=Methylobacterium iners TaxID=418707 RepID=A0ABQ4S3L8_9HYPH|nr:hypothetical protein [Methylobacterium iners]GJD97486.1 hypothetical protein OCOJLMKI_4717 [Methylobacterium iners]